MLKKRYWKPIAGILFLIMLLAAVLFFYYLLITDLLIPEYLALVAAVVVLFVYVSGVLLFYGMRKKPSSHRRIRRIIGVLLAILTSVFCLLGAYLLSGIKTAKEEVVKTETDTPRAVIGFYVKNDDPAQSLEDTADYHYGVLLLGDEGLNSNYALGQINDRLRKELSIESFPGITDLAAALRDGRIQVLAVNKSYISLLKDTETYADFSNEIRLLDAVEVPSTVSLDNTKLFIGKAEEVETVIAQEKAKIEKQKTRSETAQSKYGENDSLVFYISGIDTRESEMSNTRSDVNILVAISPKTHQILLINTPRDYYVMNPALGGNDKLTHCGHQGVSNSIAALETLYGIHIDNYCRLNFNGFIKLVDEIGGITLDNPSAFWDYKHKFYFEAGQITLNGEEALAYARERSAFADGDISRGNNQMRVIAAMIDSLKTSGATVLSNYTTILDSLAGSFETDLSSSQISDLVKIASVNLRGWEVKHYSVSGYSGMGVTASGGSEPLYFIFPKADTVNFASQLLKLTINHEVITDELLASAPSPY